MVERRGFEPLTAAVEARARLTGSSLGVVKSGRRSLIKGYFWRCAGRGCGHVFGLLLRENRIRWP